MSQLLTLEQIDKVAEVVKAKTQTRPYVGIILGSGLGAIAEAVQKADKIPYNALPSWPVSTVVGHKGRLVLGVLESQPVIIMQGRAHYYEGYSMAQLGLPVRVMQRLGVEILIVTNAAGGIHSDFQAGDVMNITDHINLMGMAGENPLHGPNLDELGPRFPDMGRAYDRELSSLAIEVAGENGIVLREGVYACLAGPNFETPAELRFLQRVGVDAVGMSTVPEVIIARHGGTRVLGFSGISNVVNLDGNTETTHEEVIEAGKQISPKLSTLIRGILPRL